MTSSVKQPLWRRLAWLALIWAGSVAALGLFAWLIRLFMLAAGMRNHCWTRSAFHRPNVAARASAANGCSPTRVTTPKHYAATAINIECSPSSRCAR